MQSEEQHIWPGAFPTSPDPSLSPPSQSRLADDASNEPEAYYTNAVSPHTTSNYSYDTSAIASSQTRVPRAVNGVLAKPSSHPNSNATRSNFRSASNPATSSNTSLTNGVKARNTTANAPRVPSSSIRERIRQIEQTATTPQPSVPARYVRSRTPTALSGAPSKPSLSEQQKENQHLTPKPTPLRKRAQNAQSPTTRRTAPKPPSESIKVNLQRIGNDRQPLFGEVITLNTNGDVAHGIPSSFARRSASDGNIQSPTASVSSSRSQHSRLDTPSSVQSSIIAGTPASPRTRSQSVTTASPVQERESAIDDRSSTFQLPALAFSQSSRPPATRAPAKPRRYSASTEHLYSASNKQANAIPRPTTPPAPSTARRYARTPDRTPTSNHSVKAFIKELPDKTTPTPSLRSSRPRVPVSAASTAASRARQNERNSTKGSRSGSPNPSSSKERRPRTKGMLRAAEEARQNSKSRTRRANYEATDSSGSLSRTTSIESGLGRSSRPNLAVDTTADLALTEPQSGNTEIDDDSPILGRSVYQPVNAGQGHDRIEDVQSLQSDPHTLSPILASPDPNESKDAAYDATPGAEATVPQENLFQQVLRLRRSDLSGSSGRQGLTDSMFAPDEEGTIQVALGATPILQTAAGDPWASLSTSGVRLSTPKPEELSDGFMHTPNSIDQSDTVSAILGPRTTQGTPGSSMTTPDAGQQFTLDSHAREEINQILQYYNSHLVEAHQRAEFQQRVAAISPRIAQSRAWADPRSTRIFLRSILDLNPGSAVQTPARPAPEAALPAFLSPTGRPASQSTSHPATARSPAYPFEGTPEGEWQPGFATVYNGPVIPGNEPIDSPSALDYYRKNSASSAPSDDQYAHWSTADGRGMLAQKPPPPPKDSAHGSLSGLGLDLSSPRLPIIEGAGQGLGLGLATTPERLASPMSQPVPTLPSHEPPPPPPRPHAMANHEFSLPPPPPLPVSSSQPIPGLSLPQPGPAVMGAYPASQEQRPGFATGKRRADRSSTDSTSVIRRSTEVASQASGVSPHRRSHSATTARDVESGRPSLEPSITTSATTAVDSQISTELKRLNRRKNIIKEFVDTEYSYNQDMVILEDIYKGTAAPILGKEDLKTIFGNLDAIRSLSTIFLDALKKAAAPVYVLPKSSRWNYKRGSFSTSNSAINESPDRSVEDLSENQRDTRDRDTFIGRVFSESLADLERTYGEYLRNRTKANNRLAELQKEQSVRLWLNECQESAKDLTSHPTLDSFLLKPFQRITRYDLLLRELIEQTPKDHPDRQDLDSAKDAVRRATTTINERQRREDIVQQVMLGQAAPSKDKQRPFGKLMKGKTSKVQQYVGIVNYAEDKDYDAIAQKFGGHFFQLQIVMRDIEKYLDDVTEYVGWFSRFNEATAAYLDVTFGTYPEIESRWIKFGQTVKSVSQTLLDSHRKDVRRIVIEPIVTLWKQHEGPQRMMQKRKKRVPEYARYKDMLDKNIKPDKRMEQQAEEFSAINETLKEELPKLYTLTKILIESCLCRFISLQVKWQHTWKKQMWRVITDAPKDPEDVHLDRLMRDFQDNFEEIRAHTEQLALCNGKARQGLANFLSPSTTFSDDTGSSHKRPSTQASRSDQTLPFYSPEASHRLSGGVLPALSPLSNAFPTPAEQYQASRTRATSAAARSPTFQRPNYTPPQTGYPPRPTTATGRHHDFSAPSRHSGSEETYYSARPISGSNYLSPDQATFALSTPTQVSPSFAAEMDAERRRQQRLHEQTRVQEQAWQDPQVRDWYANAGQQERHQRTRSRVFSSAMSDPVEETSPSPEEDDGEVGVMFLAASLFEFRIDPSRTEAGYPYLRYAPGEVFDVLGVKGELWLARNQDDAQGTIGWIWEKHFARILDA